MAQFSWTNAAGGDWSVGSNWVFVPGNGIGSPPPGIGDSAAFADLTTSYTVTIPAGSTVGVGTAGPSISIDATPIGVLTGTPTFSIFGTLTANFTYGTSAGGPTTSMMIDAGGALIVPSLLFSIDVFETVTISGTGAGGFLELGNLTVGGLVSGTNSLMILDFANAGPTNLNTGVIQFDNVDLASGIHAAQTITNVALGDEFVFQGVDFTGDTVSFHPLTNDLTVENGTTTVFTMDNVFLNSGFALAGGSFEIVNGDTIQAICFTKGTRIATPSGEVPIEQLSIGDEVVTHSGKVRPITWIGIGYVLATRGQRTAATPVIIRKGALADNEPYQDLRVTKGHSLYIDRVLIPVEFLVNHRSILWDDRAQEVSIYHIELEDHEVLIANGAAAESYRDDGNRWLFRNANVAWSFPPKEPCASVLTGGPAVDAIWQRLLERSGTRPGFPLTGDPDLHLLVDGQRVDPRMATPDGRYVFRLQAAPNLVRIVSRAGAPSELGLSRDPRLLGIAVHRIAILDEVARRIVEAADTALRDGFHGYEPGEDIRWTNGNAGLPVDLFSACSGPLDIEITTAGATRYLDEGVPLAA